MGKLDEIEARIAARLAEIDRKLGTGNEIVVNGQLRDAALPAMARGFAARQAFRAEGRRYGLYVGINNYALPYNPLPGCVADARNMAAVCRDLGGWEPGDQTILTDSAATVAAIQGALRGLAAKARPGDVVLYFQSSHGGPNGPEPASNDTCLCCHDGTYSEADIWEDLSQFQSGVKLVLVIDACYSGGLFKRGAAASTVSLLERVVSRFRAASPVGRVSADDIGWITAADNGQTSLDHPSCNGGMFTTFTLVNNGWRGGMADGFVDALLSQGRASIGSLLTANTSARKVVPSRHNGYVTFLDLAAFAIVTWADWKTSSDNESHIPQCSNEELLHSIVAGRVGAATDSAVPDGAPAAARRGSPYEYYCRKCGHTWWDDSHSVWCCPKCGGEAVHR
jgi:hypothetical protein